MLKTRDFAIAILNWNGRKLLADFLPSVIAHSGDAQVYVIDNASSDDSLDFLASEYADTVTVIRNAENYGYADGYNYGIAKIEEPVVCLLNSDIEVTENWLDPIVEAYNQNPKLAAVQPKILDLKNREYFEYAGANGGFIDNLGYPFCRGRLFNHLEKDHGQYDTFRKVFWATGACFFVKREVFSEVGKLNPVLFAHMEEIDLCWRIHNHGYEVACEPHSVVYHLGGGTLNKISPKKTYLNFRNNLIILFLNLPRRQSFRIIFMRLLLDGVAALKFLSEFKPDHFFAVFRAHLAFYRRFWSLIKYRKEPIQPLEKLSGVYHGSIIEAVFLKGVTKFEDLNPRNWG